MRDEFEMSMMGELNLSLGLQVTQLKNRTFFSRSKYCIDLLKKFDMDKCKEVATCILTTCYLDLGKKGILVDQTECRGLIGLLLYLTVSRHDIMFSVCLCAKFQSNSKESHFNAGTTNVGIWYRGEVPLNLSSYSNFDFVGCKLGRKSTSRHVIYSDKVSFHGMARSKHV